MNAPMAKRPWLRFIAISEARRWALSLSVRRLSLGTSAHHGCLFPNRDYCHRGRRTGFLDLEVIIIWTSKSRSRPLQGPISRR